jgi:hypothetical protein
MVSFARDEKSKYNSRIAEHVPYFSVKAECRTVKYGVPHNCVRALQLSVT